MSTIEKIKNKIKSLNNKNVIYYICLGILITISLFILLTTIIQTNWVDIPDLNAPILIWMISQPYVGVFFIPFLMIVIYICCFIISVGKPITIKKVKNDIRLLFENNQLTKDEYDDLYKKLENAEKRVQELKAKEQEQLMLLISEEHKQKTKQEE